jgi:serine/threonine-protein kinase
MMSQPNPRSADLEPTLHQEPEQLLWHLWQQGQCPDVRQFLDSAGELSLPQLAAVLAVDQRERWQRGERIAAETYLQHYPALRADVEHALELVYGEFLIREELREVPALEEYIQRFPQYACRLQEQAEVHRALAQASTDESENATVLDVARPATSPRKPRGRWLDVPGYQVLGELGRGGMGVVYKARQIQLKRLVALKMLLYGAQAAPEDMVRFRIEAEAVARLEHPNIVRIHDRGEHEGRHFFAMEYVEGGSLDKKLDGRPLPASSAAQLLVQLARAIDYAHRQGIVHRDLKPANVLLAPKSETRNPKSETSDVAPVSDVEFRILDFVPKITDFGLAKRLHGDSVTPTPIGALLGTPSYMSPEQAAGNAPAVGPAADVYALGAILYDALTGRPPFRSASLSDTLQQVLTEEPVPPRSLQSKVPRDLETICLKCLEKEAGKRYPSAGELADDVERFLEGKPIHARPTGALERAKKWARRRPAAAALLTVCIAAVLLLSGGGWWTALAVRAAAEREKQQRERAEHSFHQAIEAVDQMLTEVGAVDLVDVPLMVPKRERLLRKALVFFNDFLAERGDDPTVRFEAARAHGRCGDILALQGNSTEAETHYREAIELLEAVPADPDQRRELARNCNNLGSLLKKLNRFAEAESVYRRALNLRGDLAEEFGDRPEYAEERASTRYLLGALLAVQPNRQNEARECYKEALETQQRLAAKYPDELEYQRDAARTLNNLGILQRDAGQRGAAKETFALALRYQEKLVKQASDVPHYRRELARTLINRGILLLADRDFTPAEQSFEHARRRLQDLVRDYGTVPEYKHELAGALYYAGRLYRNTRQQQKAESALRDAERLCRELPKNEPKYRQQRALVFGELGRLLSDTARSREAESAYRKRTAILRELVSEFPRVHEYHSDLANALENLGWLLVLRGCLNDSGTVVELILNGFGRNPWNPPAFVAALAEGRQCLEEAVRQQQIAVAQLDKRNSRYKGYLHNHYALLAETYLRLGEHAHAASTAEALTRLLPDRSEEYYGAAAIVTRCMTLAARRPEIQDDYAVRAVALLQQAIDRASSDKIKPLLQGMKQLPVFEPLRGRPQFQKLLKKTEEKLAVEA